MLDKYICKEEKVLKKLIVALIILFAIIDLIAIFGPSIKQILKKHSERKAKLKRQKAFAKKMKDLEIK